VLRIIWVVWVLNICRMCLLLQIYANQHVNVAIIWLDQSRVNRVAMAVPVQALLCGYGWGAVGHHRSATRSLTHNWWS